MSADALWPAPRGRRSTLRDLTTVLSGTAGAQVIGLLILPALARAFSPEAFGVFQLYLSLLVFCTVGIALRIEVTLLSKPDDEAHATTIALFGLVLVVSLALSFALGLYSLIAGLGFPVAFLGLGLVGNGFAQVASYRLIRDQQYRRLATIKVSQVLVYAAVALVIAVGRPTLWGLIAADVAGRLAAGAIAVNAIKQAGTGAAPMTRLAALPNFVRENWELAAISLPGALANSAGAMLTPFMVFHVFGAAAAGQYGLVDRAMGVPVAMLVNAGSQVFAGRVTQQIQLGNRAGVRSLVLKVVGAGIIVCGTGAAVAYVLLPYIFEVAFGTGWSGAIQIARILVFSYAAAFVMGVINQTMIALGAFRLQSLWDLGWPVCIGAAWMTVIALHLDLRAAVTLHALAVGSLSLSFLFLCLAKLRDAVPPTQTSGA